MVVTTPRKPRSPVIQRAALGYDVIFSEPVDAHSARFPCMTSPLGSQAAACEGTFHQSAKPCYNRQRILLWRVVSSGLLCRIKPLRYSRGGFIFVTVLFGSYVHINVYNRAVQSSSSSSVQIMGKPQNTSPVGKALVCCGYRVTPRKGNSYIGAKSLWYSVSIASISGVKKRFI